MCRGAAEHPLAALWGPGQGQPQGPAVRVQVAALWGGGSPALPPTAGPGGPAQLTPGSARGEGSLVLGLPQPHSDHFPGGQGVAAQPQHGQQ